MSALRALILVMFATPAAAQNVTEIYKCTDPKGRPLYTSDKKDTTGKKCELVSREVNVVAPQKPASTSRAPGPGGALPKESSSDRSSARERQRDILQSELNTEEALLAKAKQALAEQEA